MHSRIKYSTEWQDMPDQREVKILNPVASGKKYLLFMEAGSSAVNPVVEFRAKHA
jgi:hypothetical protein